MKKKVIVAISKLRGGGAERVASLLANEFNKNELEVEFLLTSSREDEIINRDLEDKIPITCLRSNFVRQGLIEKLYYKVLRVFSSLFCKGFEVLKLRVPVCFAYLSFVAEYHREIKALKLKLKNDPEAIVVAFLQPTIPITLLAAKGLPNKIIISERGDPKRLMKKRYGYGFIKKYYDRADKAVFQTDDAKNTYPQNIAQKGTVIFNPIKENLPVAFNGKRNKNITTFCRISKQKNLPVLVRAFADVHNSFPEYRLRIIGDTSNADDIEALNQTKAKIKKYKIEDFVDFVPFSKNVHAEILEDALYVNSSDYEGMSNAMLEAMAIGLPTICTDCPIGGAAAVISDGENGLLTPVGDSKALAKAIIKVLSQPELAKKLSQNAVKIREELSLQKISEQWMEIL